MLTKIHLLIQEICDIKQGKSNNIKTNLPEISQSPHKGSPALLGTSDEGDLRGVYLIDSKPTHCCRSDNNDKTPQYEEPLVPDTPAPTPDPPVPPHTTPPDPPRSSGVSYVSSELSLEDNKSVSTGEVVNSLSLEIRNGSRPRISSERGVGGLEQVPVDSDPDKDSGMSRS